MEEKEHERSNKADAGTWTLHVTSCFSELDELPVLLSFPGMLPCNSCEMRSSMTLSLHFLIHKTWKVKTLVLESSPG